MNYYDLVLGSIPGSFLGVTGGLSVIGIDLTTAVPLAALLAMAVIGHALFVRAPIAPPKMRSDDVEAPAARQGLLTSAD